MFTKEKSLAVKGAAICMMIWHHCFLAGRFDGYDISFWPLTQGQAVNIAAFFKICVSLFAFVSGFGLALSWNGRQEPGKWVANRILKTLSGYWFVVILAWIFCAGMDGLPFRHYGFDRSALLGIWNGLLDFLGLSNFFGVAPLNSTWWYMSAALVFIVLVPLLAAAMDRFGWLVTLGAVLVLPRIGGGYPGGTHWLTFLPAFVLGMIAAREAFFEKWERFWSKFQKHFWGRAGKFLVMLLALLGCYKLSALLPTKQFWEIKYGLVPVAAILFISDYLAGLPLVGKALRFLGKHSMNIFLVHTFIRYIYFTDLTYSFGHGLLTAAFLLGTSVLLSLGIEGAKKALRYDARFRHI